MLAKTLQPLLASMRVAGLCCHNPASVPGDVNANTTQGGRLERLNKWYCNAVLICVWSNAIRYIPALFLNTDTSSEAVVGYVIQTIWFFQCALNCTFLRICFGSNKRFSWCMNEIQSFYESTKFSLKKTFRYSKTRYAISAITISAWIIAIVNTGYITYCLVGPSEGAKAVVSIIAEPMTEKRWYIYIVLILHYIDGTVWIFTTSFVTAASLVIKECFHALSADFLSNKTDQMRLCKISHLKTQHQQLCAVIKVLDRDFKYMLFVSYLTNIPMACFVLYHLVKLHDIDVTFGLFGFWLIVNLLNIAVPSVFVAFVRGAAHAPLEHLYDIDITGASQEEIAQLNLFVSRLNGPSIGFTAMGLLTITKEVILTLAGLYLTYFFLLLQFKI